jgi:hypothetical protein
MQALKDGLCAHKQRRTILEFRRKVCQHDVSAAAQDNIQCSRAGWIRRRNIATSKKVL